MGTKLSDCSSFSHCGAGRAQWPSGSSMEQEPLPSRSSQPLLFPKAQESSC